MGKTPRESFRYADMAVLQDRQWTRHFAVIALRLTAPSAGIAKASSTPRTTTTTNNSMRENPRNADARSCEFSCPVARRGVLPLDKAPPSLVARSTLQGVYTMIIAQAALIVAGTSIMALTTAWTAQGCPNSSPGHSNSSTCNTEVCYNCCNQCCLHFANNDPTTTAYTGCELTCRTLPKTGCN